jgi:hypothetical protein
MEEAPENGKESSHSAHANGIGIGMVNKILNHNFFTAGDKRGCTIRQ